MPNFLQPVSNLSEATGLNERLQCLGQAVTDTNGFVSSPANVDLVSLSFSFSFRPQFQFTDTASFCTQLVVHN